MLMGLELPVKDGEMWTTGVWSVGQSCWKQHLKMISAELRMLA